MKNPRGLYQRGHMIFLNTGLNDCRFLFLPQ